MHYYSDRVWKPRQSGFIGGDSAALDGAEELHAAFERFFKDHTRLAAGASPLPARAIQVH